jgi:lipoprotein NlpD
VAYSTYRVKAGDTLYSIAFRYGLNYEGLARKNDIDAPYRILIGQTLLLDDKVPSYHEVIKPETKKQPAKTPAQKPKVTTAQTDKKPANTSKSTTETTKPATESTKPATKTVTRKPAASSNYDSNRKVKGWRWPLDVTKKFHKRSGQQLLFKVPQGTDVKAVADGRVVYSGKGLVGYGHLVIIKHNQNLLSAYAFNDQVFVKERENVKAGQRISTVGKSPTGEVGLGFEIRYQGKPVNPQRYLPRR